MLLYTVNERLMQQTIELTDKPNISKIQTLANIRFKGHATEDSSERRKLAEQVCVTDPVKV